MDREYLLKLTHRTIQKYLKNKGIVEVDQNSLPSKELLEKRGVFVTLTINGELRGCIGNLEADKPIYQSVIDNSLAAAFCDPRFAPLTENEFKDIDIEISILSPLKKISNKDILSYLKKNKPGILLKNDRRQATFLPQVWEELTDPEEFLSHLSLKAGLGSNGWQDDSTKFYEYTVEIIKK